MLTPLPSDTPFPKMSDIDAGLRAFLESLSQQIGADAIVLPQPGRLTPFATDRNVSQFPSRTVPAIIRPSSVESVQTVARFFSQPSVTASLYPISTGRNWGLGSFLPTESGTVALDLSALAKIRCVDAEGGWAEIEPGVSQLELSQRLVGADRMLNVTASSGHTSVLGNTLDRGVGLRHQRVNDLLGLEVVLPGGALCRVGWWPKADGPKAINPLGLGPSLLHLFTQSNLGIVTAGVVKILPRPECQRVIRTSFQSASIRPAIDALRRWVAQELVSGVVKVYDATSTQSYGGAPNRHLVLLSVSGTTSKCLALGDILVAEAASAGCFGPVDIFDSASVPEADTVLKVVERTYAGDPSFNEHMLKAATGQEADAVDAKGNGWIFFLPFIPFTGAAVEQAMHLLDEIYEETGIHAGTTVNALSADVIDLVISMKFDPDTDQRERAARALDLAYEEFHHAGFYPYRLDVEHAFWRGKLQHDEITDHIIHQIKAIIDPTGAIAQGRYG